MGRWPAAREQGRPRREKAWVWRLRVSKRSRLKAAEPHPLSTFPSIKGGGRHITTVRTLLVDIPLVTPRIGDLITYSKERQLPMDDLYKFVLGRYQYFQNSQQVGADARVNILKDFNLTDAAYNSLNASLKKAKKRLIFRRTDRTQRFLKMCLVSRLARYRPTSILGLRSSTR